MTVQKTSPDASLMLQVRPRQLLLLVRLDAHRHLGRAAEAMNISQPAATKLLQQLEDSLGEKLFERLARGMEPTAYGEILVRYAHRVVSDFGSAREEMLALRSGLSGALRVGSVPGAVPELLAPALVEYRRRHPQVAVSVVVETSDVMQAQLEQGDVDLVLGRLTDGHDESRYASVPLLGESQVVVVRGGHPAFEREGLTLGRPGGLAMGAAAAGLAAARALRGRHARGRRAGAARHPRDRLADRHHRAARELRHGGRHARLAGPALRAAGPAAGGADRAAGARAADLPGHARGAGALARGGPVPPATAGRRLNALDCLRHMLYCVD
jgi:DNA-binding transcriptional LysR family regulator